MASTPGTAFDRVTNVHADGDGRYSATLDSVWDGPFGRPNGGVIAAILLRASQAELAQPELPPRVLNVHYLRPATRDPAQLAVHLLRVGGRNATVQVSLHQHGHLTATALITFSASRPHALTITEPAPSAPPPDQVEELSPDSLDQAPPSLRQLLLRPCFGVPILAGASDAVTGGWFSLRDDDEDQLYDAAPPRRAHRPLVARRPHHHPPPRRHTHARADDPPAHDHACPRTHPRALCHRHDP
jgi:acyl-CoA thioesterase